MKNLYLSVGISLIASVALAQTSDTVSITANVLADDPDVNVSGSAGAFGDVYLPKIAGVSCLYKIDETGKADVSSGSGGSNPDPDSCRFEGSFSPPRFTFNGPKDARFSPVIDVITNPEALNSGLVFGVEETSLIYPELRRETTSDGFRLIYPPFEFNEAGSIDVSPGMTLSVPDDAKEFADGDIGTMTATINF